MFQMFLAALGCSLLQLLSTLIFLLSLPALGCSLLQLLSTLIVFLDRESIDAMPLMVASMLQHVPESVHSTLLKTLCLHVIPVSIGDFFNVVDVLSSCYSYFDFPNTFLKNSSCKNIGIEKLRWSFFFIPFGRL